MKKYERGIVYTGQIANYLLRKDERKINEAIKYIDKCLTSDKLDLDAVLITIKSILQKEVIKNE